MNDKKVKLSWELNMELRVLVLGTPLIKNNAL